MKKILLLLFITISSLLSANTYYVAPPNATPAGKDSNPGTITQPWGTWQKAFNTAQAGDIVYFRGGVWYPKSKAVQGYPITLIDPAEGYGHNGTYDSPICFFNYPGETPVLDCQFASEAATGNTGIAINNASYIKLKGLTVRNVRTLNGTDNVIGIGITDCFDGYIHVEGCVIHNIGGAGLWGRGYDTLYVINTDVYNACDSLDVYSPGGDGDGFCLSSRGVGSDTTYLTVVKGCRAWNVSDDGFDIGTTKQLQIDSCWSWNNGDFGAYSGDGSGFKLSFSRIEADGKRWLRNCISTNNTNYGYADVNLVDEDYGPRMYYFNNVSYKDLLPFAVGPVAFDCSDPAHVIYRNNIAYDYSYESPVNFSENCHITQDHNSWINDRDNERFGIPNPAVTITNADFISLDAVQLSWPRKSNGSLPDITFMKLKEGSDLIDAGINVGIPYFGSAPDIGAFEYKTGDPNIKKVTSITISGANGTKTISTDNGTLQLTATVLPSDATNKSVTWSITSGTNIATISATGLVTALDNGTVTARATANDGSNVYGTIIITISNQVIPVTAITVTGTGGVAVIITDDGVLQLSATVLPTNATNKTVTWSITNVTGQATINSLGLVTAFTNGTVTARATANDGSGVYGTLTIIISNQVILVTGITVSGAGGATTITSDNGALQLSSAVLPTNASNKTVTWSLTNGTGQATINSSGLVTAVANGTVTARATANDGTGVSGSLLITISNQVIPVTGITVTGLGGASLITVIGGTLQLSAAILPSYATNKEVTWSVTNGTGQAIINSIGLVTALANGTVTARATAKDGSGTTGTLLITISNQIIPVKGITVTGPGGSTTITSDNGTLQLSAAVLPVNATNQTVTWSVENGTGQATISSAGLVTALSNGTVTIRATANDGSGISGTLLVTISNQIIPVTGITVTGAVGATTITSGSGTLQLSATVLPANATNQTVTWSVANGTGQATINSTGLVTAISNGTVTARATANDGSLVFGTMTITISNQITLVISVIITPAKETSSITTDNGTLQLTAVINPNIATNKAVTWTLINVTGQATINSEGLVTAIANGTVTAKATANDGSGVYGVLVITIFNQVISVESINITSESGSTYITSLNGTLQLNATIIPGNATNQTITWSLSSGSGQALINSTGLLTAISNGTVTASAMANDGSGVYGTIFITIESNIDAPFVAIVDDNEMKFPMDESYLGYKVSLYNLYGNLMNTKLVDSNLCVFDISSFRSGLYVAVLSNNMILKVVKVIVP